MRGLALLALFAAALHAQAPDIVQTGTFTGTGDGTPLFVGGGAQNGVVAWRLTYFVDGTSITAAQAAIKGADAATGAGCTSASYSTITTSGSSLVETANPSASAAAANVGVKTYFPCIRASITAITGSGGTISYQLMGWRYLFAFPISATVTFPTTQDVNLTQIKGTAASTNSGTADAGTLRVILPTNQPAVQVGGGAAAGATPSGNPVPAGFQNSAGVIIPEYCTSRFAFSNPGTGSTQLVAVSGSTTIRVCELFFSGDTLTTIQLVTGTGATCTSPTAETGVMSGPGGGLFGVALDFPSGALVTTSTKTLCLSLSAASTGGGYITYSQR
jgi:hypothetical protein